MNKYPTWWNETLTVYNKLENADKSVTWYKTVLTGCFWKDTSEKILIGQTTLDTNNLICRIPKNPNFLEKYLWDESDKNKYFTLALGDIIVRGNVNDVIDEYTKDQRSTDLIKKYKKQRGVLVVERVVIDVDGGRGNEHYHVRGT